jgi:hypothetical protein
MKNGMWAKEDYRLYTIEYGLIKVRKETYRPPTS